jgi:predicted transcriptional regulator
MLSPLDKAALTVAEVAELTGWSRQTVTRMYENETGVLILKRGETMHKRSYRSIRIPRAIYERVVRKVTN